jgi:hypothetical protein
MCSTKRSAVQTVIFDTNSYVVSWVHSPPHSAMRCDLPFHVEMPSVFLHGEPHALGVPRRFCDGSIIFPPMWSALDTRPLRANTPSSLQSQSDPSTGVDGRIRRWRRPMSMVHRVSTPHKHHETGCMCIENMAWKPRNQRPRPLTVDEFVHRHQWMDRRGGRESLGYWDEEGVCKSAEPSRGWGRSSSTAAQSTAKATSKKEVDFHVESQRIAERTLPYQPISWWYHYLKECLCWIWSER